MKSIALLLTIVLTVTISSQAQTVQKSNYLQSNVIKGQPSLMTKTNSHLVDSLTLGEKLMGGPTTNNLYFSLNRSLSIANAKYFNTVKVKHKALYTTLDAMMGMWVSTKYDNYNLEDNWFGPGWQHPFKYQMIKRTRMREVIPSGQPTLGPILGTMFGALLYSAFGGK